MAGGATLCVTVDNLGRAAEIGLGRATRPDPDEPGLRGLPRLLDLLDELGIAASFFVEGWNGLHHPEALHTIAEHGHEVGLHGWVHERWSELDEGHREALLFDGTRALNTAGIRPRGFRAPGGYRGTRTAATLAELGYLYDSSIDADTEHARLEVRLLPEGIVNIPWRWSMVDYYHYFMHPEGHQTPQQVIDHFNATLDQAVIDNGLVTLIVHPFVTAVDDGPRFKVLQSFLSGAVSRSDVDVVDAGTIAERYVAKVPSTLHASSNRRADGN